MIPDVEFYFYEHSFTITCVFSDIRVGGINRKMEFVESECCNDIEVSE